MQDSLRFLAAAALVLASAAAIAAPAEKVQTATGVIARLDAAKQTVVVKTETDEKTFVWNEDTRINGVLAPGAKVTLRFAPQPDGRNLAYQISVGR